MLKFKIDSTILLLLHSVFMLALCIKGVTEGTPVLGRGVSSSFFAGQRWLKAAG